MLFSCCVDFLFVVLSLSLSSSFISVSSVLVYVAQQYMIALLVRKNKLDLMRYKPIFYNKNDEKECFFDELKNESEKKLDGRTFVKRFENK